MNEYDIQSNKVIDEITLFNKNLVIVNKIFDLTEKYSEIHNVSLISENILRFVGLLDDEITTI